MYQVRSRLWEARKKCVWLEGHGCFWPVTISQPPACISASASISTVPQQSTRYLGRREGSSVITLCSTPENPKTDPSPGRAGSEEEQSLAADTQSGRGQGTVGKVTSSQMKIPACCYCSVAVYKSLCLSRPQFPLSVSGVCQYPSLPPSTVIQP